MVVWGDPRADHHAARRHRLDRQPRPRAEQAAGVDRTRRSRSRSSRSIGNGCSSIPTRASRPSTSSSFPAGTPVSFRLTSATVWNVFFVPQMGTMIYTMPRMTTRLNLQADRQGVYRRAVRAFQRRRLPGNAVQGPVAAARSVRHVGARRARVGAEARRAGYAELSKPSSYVKPMTYGAVAPGLFDAIVANRAPPIP